MATVCLKEKYVKVTLPAIPPDVIEPVVSVDSNLLQEIYFMNKADSNPYPTMPQLHFIGWNSGTKTNVDVEDNSLGPGNGKIVSQESHISTGLEDTRVSASSPDSNESGDTANSALLWDGKLTRSLIKCPANETLYLKRLLLGYPSVEVTVKEVDPTSYSTSTVTWNTQPALGATITTYTPPETEGWDEIPTGTTGAICLKITNETISGGVLWNSLETGISTRPYYIGFSTAGWVYAYTFAQAMKPDSLSWGCNALPGNLVPTFAWSNGNKTLTITFTFNAVDQEVRFLHLTCAIA